MELHEIPEAFQTKLRTAILSSLVTGPRTFREIKELTLATDGNISIQVNKLEELGYLVSRKEFVGKKPCTTYFITEYGAGVFREYVEMLERLLNAK